MTSFNAAVSFDDASTPFDGPPDNPQTFPDVSLWWSPTTGPLEPPAWEAFPTITVAGQTKGRVRAQDGVQIRRGRSDELGPFEAGTMSLTLDNRDRALDPLNTASSYYGTLKPNVPVQLRAQWAATEHVLFTGLVDAWPQLQHASQNDLVVELACTDLTKVLGPRGFRPYRPFILDTADGQAGRLDVGNQLNDRKPRRPAEYSGARVAELLTTAGVDATLQAVDGGDTRLKADLPADDTLGDYFDRIVRTEAGRFYIAKDGTVTFAARHSAANLTSSATFTDATSSSYRYADLVLDPLDMSVVVNEVRRGVDDDLSVTRRSSGSIRRHGLVSDDQTDLLFADTSEMSYAAGWWLARYGEPRARVKAMTVVPQRAASTLFPFVLAAEVGDRFTVQTQPMDAGVTVAQTVDVESVTHEIGAQFWATTFECSLADTTQYFQIDTATYGQLDAGNLLNY